MRVLVACETSGIVREAFRRRGANAVSCDLLPADDASPHHYIGDARDLIRARAWDLVVAHPPCTHLAVAGAKHFAAKRADGRQRDGIHLFLDIVNAADWHAAAYVIENPVGIMSRVWRKPNQIIHPWQFGHEASKATCLWFRGVPPLTPTRIVGRGEFHTTKSGRRLPSWYNLPPGPLRWKIRSKTFSGIAAAMADQWGPL